jgi:hypothetical protein
MTSYLAQGITKQPLKGLQFTNETVVPAKALYVSRACRPQRGDCTCKDIYFRFSKERDLTKIIQGTQEATVCGGRSEIPFPSLTFTAFFLEERDLQF